ncbi:MAG: hypothetical protein WC497_00265 [Patescibacteria group bacterium]
MATNGNNFDDALGKSKEKRRELDDRTGRSKSSQEALSRQLGQDPKSWHDQQIRQGKDAYTKDRLASSMGSSIGDVNQPRGIRGRVADKMDRSIQDFDARQGVAGAAGERSAAKQLGGAKAAALKKAAEGGSAEEVGEAAGAAALQAKKIQQYRMLLMVLKGVKVGAAATVVGIIITILIWVAQVILSKVFGKKEFELDLWEKIIAYPICFIILVFVVTQIAVLVQALGLVSSAINWIS